MADPVELAPGCWSDGRLTGIKATLVVDPVSTTRRVGTPDEPTYALFTSAGTIVELPQLMPTTVYVHAGAVAAARRAAPDSAVRGVHAAAVLDLGGVVAEITHLGPGQSGSDLVVSGRVVDERGVPVRAVPPVVYVGDLMDPGELAVSSPADGGSEQGWAASLDLLGGLMGATGLAVRRSGVTATYEEVESQRGMRLERGGLIRMPDPDRRLPLI